MKQTVIVIDVLKTNVNKRHYGNYVHTLRSRKSLNGPSLVPRSGKARESGQIKISSATATHLANSGSIVDLSHIHPTSEARLDTVNTAFKSQIKISSIPIC